MSDELLGNASVQIEGKAGQTPIYPVPRGNNGPLLTPAKCYICFPGANQYDEHPAKVWINATVSEADINRQYGGVLLVYNGTYQGKPYKMYTLANVRSLSTGELLPPTDARVNEQAAQPQGGPPAPRPPGQPSQLPPAPAGPPKRPTPPAPPSTPPPTPPPAAPKYAPAEIREAAGLLWKEAWEIAFGFMDRGKQDESISNAHINDMAGRVGMTLILQGELWPDYLRRGKLALGQRNIDAAKRHAEAVREGVAEQECNPNWPPCDADIPFS